MSIFKKINDLKSVSEKFNIQQEDIINYFKALGITLNDTDELTDKMVASIEKYQEKKISVLKNIDFFSDEKNKTIIKELIAKGENYLDNASYNDAFDCFYLAYTFGDVEASYYLASVLENDFGYGINYPKILEYYNIACDANIGKAQYRLAQYYRDGIGCEKNYLQAVKLFKIALKQGYNSPADYDNIDQCVQNMYKQQAEKGDAKGYFRLASYLVKKKGLDFDSPIIKEYVSLAAKHGDSSSLYRMGLTAEAENNPLQAKEYFIQAAKNGNTPAALKLQTNYNEDIMAIMADNDDGLVNMGKYYDRKGDIDQAIKYYLKAAELNNSEAQYRLASIYIKYPSYEIDLTKNHIYWLKQSAEQNNYNACYKLGLCYEGEDTIVDEDRKIALEYFEKAAEENNSLAQSKLGYYYKQGVFVSKNPEKSFYWYKKGAENGNSISQNQLAFCYMNGDGTERDYEQSYYWFLQAAEQKHYIAEFQLGICFMHGRGVKRDYQQAREWFDKALSHGYLRAQKQLDILNSLDTINGNTAVEKLKENIKIETPTINITEDINKINSLNTDKDTIQSEQNSIDSAIPQEQTSQENSNALDVDNISEKEAIELLFKLNDKIKANVIDLQAAEQRLRDLKEEEQMKNAEQLLAQKGFTEEQLALLKTYFNKE